MTQYNVTGMSCAACSARVEKAVSRIPGVTSCSVSLLTNSMGVEGSAAPQDIIAAVQAVGYGASLKGAGKAAPSAAEAEAALEDHETPKLKRRLLWSLGFLLVLMYFSMGHMMWGWPLPSFYDGNHVAMGLTQLLLTVIIMVINQKFFISGFKGLIHRAPNMDTLVALGATAAFGYSTYALFAMTGAQMRGDDAAVMRYMMDFYFESAAMILTLITVGKMLEARSKGKTTDALKGLMKLAPKTATVLRGGKELSVPVEQVQKDEVFLVRPGESIPVDGVVLEGSSAGCVLMEKTSKLMDFFLVTVEPAAMVLGKILATALAGILQMAVWLASLAGGVALGTALARAAVPGQTPAAVQVMESLAQLTGLFSLPALLLAAAIILAGFLMYCSLSAIGGSLAGKAEDLGTTNVLFSMVLVASFLACIIAGGMDGSAAGAAWLDWVPFTAVLIAPAHVLLGELTLAQGAAICALVLVCAVAIAWLAGRIYRMMSLYKGNPPSIQKALRMIREN